MDPAEFSSFLDEALGPVFGRFMIEHGDWWHRGAGGRFVATCDGAVAGYRAIVPSVFAVAGAEVPGVWAMHLYVSPRFRGKGLQRRLDQAVLDAAGLRMSFPNRVGAEIYAKQGYGLRGDLSAFRLPLYPRAIEAIQRAAGEGSAAMRGAALAASPAAASFRTWARAYRPKRTEVADALDAGATEDLFRRSLTSDMVTTVRDADFLRWRYLEAPYRSDLVFYATSSNGRETHRAVVRYMAYGGATKARILDVIGDFDDEPGLSDLLRTMVRDAASREALFVEILATYPPLARAARRAGFLVRDPKRFRWLSDVPRVHDAFSTAALQWSMADGENDYPA